jgi:molybdenum cofactor cytidylyltransferase
MQTTATPARNLGGVILTAGRSARMGRPKLLLPWGGTSVLGHQLRTWQALGVSQLAVVWALGDAAIEAELDRLQFPSGARIRNPDPDQGMFGSIRRAASWPGWQAGLTQMAVILGDQPHPRLSTLQALLDFSARHPNAVCQPRAAGRLRHPVILPRPLLQSLAATGASSLREFLESWPGERVACALEDPGLTCDLNTPADYQQALAQGFPS